MTHPAPKAVVAAATGYGFQGVLPAQPFEQALARVTQALEAEGLGTLA